MIKHFEFYFDFASPYTFLAHKEIIKLEKEKNFKVKYMPILLGALLKLTGSKANADIPIKAKYMIKDCKLWAEKKNILFKFNNYFPIITLNLMRCVLIAEKEGVAQNFINRVFDSIWVDGLNLNDKLVLEKLLANMNINSKEGAIMTSIQKKLSGDEGNFAYSLNNNSFSGKDLYLLLIKKLLSLLIIHLVVIEEGSNPHDL